MEILTLDLEVQKTEVIRGESIRFVLTLTNKTDAPLTLLDSSITNRAFRIHLKGIWGIDAWADQMSIQEREGDHVDEPRTHPESPLAPGEKMVVRGDVISWIGELEPGSYTLQGRYTDLRGYHTESAIVEVKVAEAAPAYARSAVQNLFLSHSPRDTAWIHSTPTGSELFLLQSSPKNPFVAYANVPLAKIEAPLNVFPSSCNVAAPRVQHLLWASPDEGLQVVRHRFDLPAEPPLKIALPNEDLEPLCTPYSDERGNLHALLATADGDAAFLFQLMGKGTNAFHPIQAKPPLAGPHAALWGGDETLVFAWAEEEGNDVFAASASLESPPRQITGSRIFTADQPVIDLLLAQRYDSDGDRYNRILFVLAHDMVNDIFLRWKVNLADNTAVEDGRFVVEGAGTLRIIQSVLTEDLTPLYLFAGQDEAVAFADAKFSAFVPVMDSNGKPVPSSAFPQIVVPNRFSKLPSVCVRHIEQGKRFAYARMS